MSILSGVAEIVAQQMGIDSQIVTPNSRFSSDLRVDGLDMVEIVMAAEKRFEVEIPDAIAEKLDTINELALYIEWCLRPATGRPIFTYKRFRRTQPPEGVGQCVNVSAKAVGLNVALLILVSAVTGISIIKQFMPLLVLGIGGLLLVTLAYLRTRFQAGNAGGALMKDSEQSVAINISGGQVGNLNLGKLRGNVKANLSSLVSQGGDEVAESFAKLLDAVQNNKSLSQTDRNASLEQIEELSRQAGLPADQRKVGIAQSLITSLTSLLGGVDSLALLWSQCVSIARDIFGLAI
jgi:acyl carrier protein